MKRLIASILLAATASWGQIAGWQVHNNQQWYKDTVAISDSLLVEEYIRLATNGEVRIGTNGEFLMGTPTQLQGASDDAVTEKFQVHGNDQNDSRMLLSRFTLGVQAPYLTFLKSRNDVIGNNTIVADDDGAGYATFHVDDGTDYDTQIASIHAEVDDPTPAANQVGGALVFSTTATTGRRPTEAVRIDNSGYMGLGGAPGVQLHVTDGGTDPSWTSGTMAAFQNNSTNSDIARVAIVGGNATGFSILQFGDVDDDNEGQITYNHSDNSMNFGTTDGSADVYIVSTGDVGIGVPTPVTRLDVREDGTTKGGVITWGNASEGRFGELGMDGSGATYRAHFGYSNNEHIAIMNTGEISINPDGSWTDADHDLEINDGASCSEINASETSWTDCSSSEEWKTNITPVDSSAVIAAFRSVNPVTWNYREDFIRGRWQSNIDEAHEDTTLPEIDVPPLREIPVVIVADTTLSDLARVVKQAFLDSVRAQDIAERDSARAALLAEIDSTRAVDVARRDSTLNAKLTSIEASIQADMAHKHVGFTGQMVYPLAMAVNPAEADSTQKSYSLDPIIHSQQVLINHLLDRIESLERRVSTLERAR